MKRLLLLLLLLPLACGGSDSPSSNTQLPTGPADGATDEPYEAVPAVTPDQMPEGNTGLAAQYPGDTGIQDDPAVVFVETFEGLNISSSLQNRWESVSNPQLMSFDADIPAGSSGTQSLLVSHVGGPTTGGHLYRRLGNGYDKLYFRFYVKFDADANPIHHFVHMGGYSPSTAFPQGGAGGRPAGNERFTNGIEPHGGSWVWDHYAYWSRMRGSPPQGQTWGNSFLRDTAPDVGRGEWECIEVMMKMIDVGDSNGEMALWINGSLQSYLGKGFPMGKWIYDKFNPGQGGSSVYWSDAQADGVNFTVPSEGIPFEGFRWRTTGQLNLNFFWLLVYITTSPANKVTDVRFDDIVIATDYIGPISQ